MRHDFLFQMYALESIDREERIEKLIHLIKTDGFNTSRNLENILKDLELTDLTIEEIRGINKCI